MRTATIDSSSHTIFIKFSDPDRATWALVLSAVKSLDGRIFNAQQKVWTAPASNENLDILEKAGFDIQGRETINQDLGEPWKEIQLDPEHIEGLRPYQVEGLQFFVWRNGRAICGDDMGIGKTVQALSYLRRFPEKRPVLIICPASVKLQWQREFSKWVKNEPIQIISGRSVRALNPERNYIINWNLLSDKERSYVQKDKSISKKDWEGLDPNEKTKWKLLETETGWVNELQKIPFQVIIGDEIQAVGNPKAYQTKAFSLLGKHVPNLIALSGTPIRSRTAQFFTILNMINPELFPNRWKFLNRYADPKFNGFGWSFNGSSHVEELHRLIKPLMIRRLKSEVLKDLPPKIRTYVPLEIEEGPPQEITISENLDIRQQLEQLTLSAFPRKQKQVVNWINEFLESGEKLVVFAYHKTVIRFLMEQFAGKAVKIDGETSSTERDQNVRAFQEDDDIRLFIGNILAAGVGIDGLQKVCSNAAFVELIFTPTDHLQAEDRLHRIGQAGSVNISYLIAPGTIEDDLVEILDERMKMMEKVLDGNPNAGDLLGELIKRYQKKAS